LIGKIVEHPQLLVAHVTHHVEAEGSTVFRNGERIGGLYVYRRHLCVGSGFEEDGIKGDNGGCNAGAVRQDAGMPVYADGIAADTFGAVQRKSMVHGTIILDIEGGDIAVPVVLINRNGSREENAFIG